MVENQIACAIGSSSSDTVYNYECGRASVFDFMNRRAEEVEDEEDLRNAQGSETRRNGCSSVQQRRRKRARECVARAMGATTTVESHRHPVATEAARRTEAARVSRIVANRSSEILAFFSFTSAHGREDEESVIDRRDEDVLEMTMGGDRAESVKDLPNRFQRLCLLNPPPFLLPRDGAFPCVSGGCLSSVSCTAVLTSAFGQRRQQQQHTKMLYAVLCLLFVFSNVGKLVSCSPSSRSISSSFNFNATEEEAVVVADEEEQVTRGHYTPMWAVQIPGGEEVANNVARHHGFVNYGKVSG